MIIEWLSKLVRKGSNQKRNINIEFIKWAWNNRFERIKNLRATFHRTGKNQQRNRIESVWYSKNQNKSEASRKAGAGSIQ